MVFLLAQSKGYAWRGCPCLDHAVPIEEYVFYFSGLVAILLLYVWLSEHWLAACTVKDYAGEARYRHRLLQFHRRR